MIRPSDISNFWYHSHMISRISWYVRLYSGTCTAGWRGLGAPASRCSTSSGLAIANVLGGQWGLLFSWTATAWIPRMDLLQSMLPSFKLKVENFKLEVTSCLKLWTAAHHRHIHSHLANFSPSWPLGSCRLAALCPGLGHWQSHRSATESARQTRIHCQSGSAWLLPALQADRWQLCSSVVCLSSCTSLHER